MSLFKKPSFLLGMAIMFFVLAGMTVVIPVALSIMFGSKTETVVAAALTTQVPTVTATPTTTLTPTRTKTASPSSTSTVGPTDTAVPTRTPSPTANPTNTPVTTRTAFPTAKPTDTLVPEKTPFRMVVPTETRVPTLVSSSVPVTRVLAVSMIAAQPTAQGAATRTTTHPRTKTKNDVLLFVPEPGECWLFYNAVPNWLYPGVGGTLTPCTQMYLEPGVEYFEPGESYDKPGEKVPFRVVSRDSSLKFSGVLSEKDGITYYQVVPIKTTETGIYWVKKE